MVITDGLSSEKTHTVQEADKLKQRGVEIIAIGIGSGIDRGELTGIASNASLVLHVADFNAIQVINDATNNIACTSK